MCGNWRTAAALIRLRTIKKAGSRNSPQQKRQRRYVQLGIAARLCGCPWPESVRRLVLASPVNPWSRLAGGRLAFFASAPGAFLMRCCTPLLWRTRGYFLRRMYGDPARVTADAVRAYSAALAVPGTVEHL